MKKLLHYLLVFFAALFMMPNQALSQLEYYSNFFEDVGLVRRQHDLTLGMFLPSFGSNALNVSIDYSPLNHVSIGGAASQDGKLGVKLGTYFSLRKDTSNVKETFFSGFLGFTKGETTTYFGNKYMASIGIYHRQRKVWFSQRVQYHLVDITNLVLYGRFNDDLIREEVEKNDPFSLLYLKSELGFELRKLYSNILIQYHIPLHNSSFVVPSEISLSVGWLINVSEFWR